MPWYDNIYNSIRDSQPSSREPGEHLFETVTLSPDRISDFAARMNLQVTQTDDGTYVALPPNVDLGTSEIRLQFIDHWLDESVNKTRTEHERNRRVQTYKIMDEAMAEACISLDTYSDECLAVGFIDEPIKITFNDKGVGNQVMEVLQTNDVLKRSRSFVRNLIKYGDLGVKIIIPNVDKDVPDIGLDYIDPLLWECIVAKERKICIGYKIDEKFNRWIRAPQTGVARRKALQPWEFVQMSVYDQDMKPYGRSLLEGMRIDFDHLVTLEALLALSRASRVERLVIKIPTGSTNPVQAAQKIQSLKAQFKNIIFKDTSLGTKTYGKTPGLTDILFMPSDKGFEADKLSSTVDLSSVEDVAYFRDKAISVTGLPKGYFLADQVTDRGSALQQQDIKFARKLVTYQNAFVEGLTKLCMTVAVYVAKADLSSFEVTVALQRPTQIAVTMIENYKLIADTATVLIQGLKETLPPQITPQGQELPAPLPPNLYSNILQTLGMPKTVAQLFMSGGAGGASPLAADADYITLTSSKDPRFNYLRPGLARLAEALRHPSGFERFVEKENEAKLRLVA
jgi:hypothetical protein